MDASVIIPTFGRPEKLGACLSALAEQTMPPHRFDVIVTIDGREPATALLASTLWRDAGADPARLTVLQGDHAGPCAARNRAIDAAGGRILIFFNDDVIPHPDCVWSHVEAHRERADRSAIIVGDSPWRIHDPDSMFARMLRETSMVFFHHRMRDDADPKRDWGFRHAWLLNLSAPAHAVRAVGGLRLIQSTYGRDDDELAYRLVRELRTPVLFRPGAVATHDHPMSPLEYLIREYELGYGAPAFARGAPQCALEMFRRDLLSTGERTATLARLDELRQPAAEAAEWFARLAKRPPDDRAAAPGPQELYQQHLPLKRWTWAAGLLDGLEGRPFDHSGGQRTLGVCSSATA